MLIATANNNVCHLLINKEGFDLIKKAAINANPICDKALRTITIGKPASRNPSPVPKATNIATGTDIKILKNKGTWLAKVKEAGPILILAGMIIGIMIAKATKIEV